MSSQELIINRIIDLKELKIHNEEEIINSIEKEFELNPEEAESIFDLVQTGIFRALFIAEKKEYPSNNLNDHPVITETIRIFLNRTGKRELNLASKNKKKFNFQFWKNFTF